MINSCILTPVDFAALGLRQRRGYTSINTVGDRFVFDVEPSAFSLPIGQLYTLITSHHGWDVRIDFTPTEVWESDCNQEEIVISWKMI